MNAIGGYFELELKSGEHYHKGALYLNSARNCFEYVLRSRNYAKVYIPYYTCEVLLEPVQKADIHYEFYSINEKLEPVDLPLLAGNEAFLYTNYFGLKQQCVERLAQHYGSQLIVDNAQAFYANPLKGIDTFYSARKFFGVPDGAYLYTDKLLQQEYEQDYSYERMAHLLKRIDCGAEAGYSDFRKNDDALCHQAIKKMSKLTAAILSNIDHAEARKQRSENFQMLDRALGHTNHLHFVLNDDCVPMVYPYLTNEDELKQKLIENKIFVATYWPNVMDWCKEKTWEYQLAHRTCFLPVDQRYGNEDMNKILNVLQK